MFIKTLLYWNLFITHAPDSMMINPVKYENGEYEVL